MNYFYSLLTYACLFRTVICSTTDQIKRQRLSEKAQVKCKVRLWQSNHPTAWTLVFVIYSGTELYGFICSSHSHTYLADCKHRATGMSKKLNTSPILQDNPVIIIVVCSRARRFKATCIFTDSWISQIRWRINLRSARLSVWWKEEN